MGIGNSHICTTLYMLHYLNLIKAEKSHDQLGDALKNHASFF